MAIQALLLAVAAALLLLFIWNWHSVYAMALKRLAFLAFIVAFVVAVLKPSWVTSMAHHMGVGRGTDLVLYLFVIAFLFASVNTYFRFKTQENRLTELARSLAIRDAITLNAERFEAGRR